MKILRPSFFVIALCFSTQVTAQFYGDPPNETHPWAVHDQNRPSPPIVTPADSPGAPPSDAIVLFDGTKESFEQNWTHENEKRKTDWKVEDGNLICLKGAGYIRTTSEWADCQLHLEWAAPTEIVGDGQGRGNSGVFLMGMTEIQILDNFNNPTYPDGAAGAVYGVMPPAVNPLRPPGQWQTYDIIFRKPIFENGTLIRPGSQTVLINGVVVQDSTPIEGGGGHKKRSKSREFPDVGPLRLQDHGNPVRFRNIWYRPLRPTPEQGGTDGALSPETTAKKRAEIAEMISADAANLDGVPKLLRELEVLTYVTNEQSVAHAEAITSTFVSEIQKTPKDQMESRKGDIMNVKKAVDYLVTFKRLPADFPAKAELQKIAEENEWEKKK